jgi:hypothetical protein
MSECICGAICTDEFCSEECRNLYDENIGIPKNPGFDLFKVYEILNGTFKEYTGPYNYIKLHKKCGCGGTKKSIPIDTYYIEYKDGYYMFNVDSKGRMIIITHPVRGIWSCDKCNIIDNC